MTLRGGTRIVLACFIAASGAGPVASYSQEFMCFFAPGTADLTVRCREVVGIAAARWHRLREGRQADLSRLPNPPLLPAYTARLEVLGFAQQVENSRKVNGLSALRALAVATELDRLLVPSEFITPVGLGSEHPFVLNAPLDPQNRRVMIIFQ